MELPVSTAFKRRPVYERLLRRKHAMDLEPPTDAEKRDAILVLADPWDDEVTLEAFRILDEAQENASLAE